MKHWLADIQAKTDTALAEGALIPMQSEEAVLTEAGREFIVRWVSSLAKKDSASASLPGGVRDPNFNPFLTPEEALKVGEIGEHVIILNKFPVCLRHVVLARKTFQEQLSPLDWHDFFAMSVMLSQEGGLSFYNGGPLAGASQRHKHVQWIPDEVGNANLRIWTQDLPQNSELLSCAVSKKLSISHVFVQVGTLKGESPEMLADRLLSGFKVGFEALNLQLDAVGHLPPMNILVGDSWLLIVPRGAEKCDDIAVSAVFFGGTIFVRQVEQLAEVRARGVLNLLAEVGLKS